MIHIALHFLVPVMIAWLMTKTSVLQPKELKQAVMIMWLTMLVDLDHLLATPIYDPLRCSIGFHPLHQWPAIFIYAVLAGFKKTRWIGIGLIIHMILDSLDCWHSQGWWL